MQAGESLPALLLHTFLPAFWSHYAPGESGSCTGTVLTHLHPLLPSPTGGGCVFITPFETACGSRERGGCVVLCAGQGIGTGQFVQMILMCIFLFIPFCEAEASLHMVTWAALMLCCFQIKAKAYAQTPVLPPTGIESSGRYQARSPKDLSWIQVDSEFSQMTQLVERTVQKVQMLGKVGTVLKDSSRIRKSLDELNKDP